MAKRGRDEDLDSEFEFSSEKRKRTWRDDPLAVHKSGINVPHHSVAIPSKQLVTHEYDKEEWRARRYHYLSMDAYSRHKALVNHYLLFSGHGIEHLKRSTERDRNDYTVLGEQHKFLWKESDRAETWEQKLAKSYYDRLFKEYAICDLTRYKENKIALRWRVEKEVVDGKGQFACGNKHCSAVSDLQSWEVNFNYLEHGDKKQALVKVRLCGECSAKLNYHHKRKLWKQKGKKRDVDRDSRSSRKKHSRKDKKLKQARKKKKKKHKHGRKDDDRKKQRTSERSDSSEGSEGESEHSNVEGDDGRDDGGSVWTQSAQAVLERSKEDEFEDYFKDMLL